MLMGEYSHALDKKGRVIIPARFREELGDSFIITRGLDNCLFLYPLREWALLENKFKALPLAKADARAFMRLFFSGASEVEVDRQGRILIPPPLREHAMLKKDVIIIGVSTRAEIWSKERWEEYTSSANLSYEQVAEKMVDFQF